MHRFIFQCNANESCGLGHFMRCLNIAVALSTINRQNLIIFNGRFNDLAQKKLKNHNFQAIYSQSLDGFSDVTLILDDYSITQDNIKFSKIDDFNQFDLSNLDLIVNFRSCAELEDYSNRNTCLGLNYFPFKKPLIDIRKNNLNKISIEVSNMVIFIGGSDQLGLGKKVLNLLLECVTNKNIYLIDKSCDIKTSYISNHNKITVLPLIDKIEDLYQLADVYITGGGLSKYEVAFCCIPNASISQNSGQDEDTQILAKSNLTYNLGIATNISSQQIQEELMTFLQKPHLLKILNASKKHFSTNSTDNLAQKIIEVSA